MGDTVLVVGGGGREHALAWALAQSPQVDEVLLAPGNAGTAVELGCRNLNVKATDIEGVVAAAQEHEVRLVVVGPEDPLVDGLVDACEAAGIPALVRRLLRLNWKVRSRTARRFCSNTASRPARPKPSPTPRPRCASRHTRCRARHQGERPCRRQRRDRRRVEAGSADAIHDILVDGRFGAAGAEVLLEERLFGTEVSVLAFATAPTSRSCPPLKTTNACSTVTRAPTRGAWGRSTVTDCRRCLARRRRA